jgi:hypothetical protein
MNSNAFLLINVAVAFYLTGRLGRVNELSGENYREVILPAVKAVPYTKRG